jgi:hypothetical protein
MGENGYRQISPRCFGTTTKDRQKQLQQQIPFGDDNENCNSKDNCNRKDNCICRLKWPLVERLWGSVGEGDVDGIAFDDAMACGWGLGDDGADGGDGVGDGFG